MKKRMIRIPTPIMFEIMKQEFEELVAYEPHSELDEFGNKKTTLNVAQRFLDVSGYVTGSISKEDVIGACEVNLWGAHNMLKQGINAGAFAPRTHGVLILSTSATVGSEGRASAAYEESKGGLMNLLTLQSRYFLEQHGLVINGLAPSPLRGPMAAQNPVSAGRLQAVEDEMHILVNAAFFARQAVTGGNELSVD